MWYGLLLYFCSARSDGVVLLASAFVPTCPAPHRTPPKAVVVRVRSTVRPAKIVATASIALRVAVAVVSVALQLTNYIYFLS